jgi:hypothetical protein
MNGAHFHEHAHPSYRHVRRGGTAVHRAYRLRARHGQRRHQSIDSACFGYRAGNPGDAMSMLDTARQYADDLGKLPGAQFEQDLTTVIGKAMTNMTTQLAKVPAGPAFDKAYLTSMIPHHEMAIIVARPVPTRAVHPALRSLGEQITSAQSAQVQQMTDWLREWYGVTN